jgi:hypothetical protein
MCADQTFSPDCYSVWRYVRDCGPLGVHGTDIQLVLGHELPVKRMYYLLKMLCASGYLKSVVQRQRHVYVVGQFVLPGEPLEPQPTHLQRPVVQATPVEVAKGTPNSVWAYARAHAQPAGAQT